MNNTQPDALRLADWLQAAVQIFPQRSVDDPGGYASEVDQIMDDAAAELRRQHAEIADLRAQLAAIGAGGVSPLMGAAGDAGWKPLIEAPLNEFVLVAAEFDGPGDWRIKCGYLDEQTAAWRVFGASWEPAHWMPLPPPPSSAKGVAHG